MGRRRASSRVFFIFISGFVFSFGTFGTFGVIFGGFGAMGDG